MHESLLKGKAFSSRFWGWGRNRSPSPPLPGKGLYGAAARPGHPGDRQGGTGVTQGSPHSPACHTVFPADPAVNTKHWWPYRDRSLLSRHAEKPSGSAASPSSSWPPAVRWGISVLPACRAHSRSPHPPPRPSAPGRGPCSLSGLCGSPGDTGPRSRAPARRRAPWGTLGQPGQGRCLLETQTPGAVISVTPRP